MKFLNANRDQEDLEILGKICFDTLCLNLDIKQKSEEFCGIYIDGRNQEFNFIENFAAAASFKIHSEYDYPLLVLSPNSNNILNGECKKYSVNHIQIPELNSHEKYSEFLIKHVWNYIPKHFPRLLFIQSDGFLIKKGWERFVLDNKLDYVGAAWCHEPGIDHYSCYHWLASGFPRIRCGNGGFSYRTRFCCEELSNSYRLIQLREANRKDNRSPPEDLFYSHLINGTKIGRVATVKECMQFSLDPITLKEYENKTTMGFHYPRKINEFQQYRDYYNSLK